MGWSSKAVIAAALLAVVLVAAVPVAFLAGVIMMLLGHVVGGLALFGASVLVAVVAVTVASMTGVRHVRKLVSRAVADLQGRAGGQENHPVVTLDRADYE